MQFRKLETKTNFRHFFQFLSITIISHVFCTLSNFEPTVRPNWLKADLHGTILSHATSLRHAYDTKKSM